jgi:hypothetical protein
MIALDIFMIVVQRRRHRTHMDLLAAMDQSFMSEARLERSYKELLGLLDKFNARPSKLTEKPTPPSTQEVTDAAGTVLGRAGDESTLLTDTVAS